MREQNVIQNQNVRESVELNIFSSDTVNFLNMQSLGKGTKLFVIDFYVLLLRVYSYCTHEKEGRKCPHLYGCINNIITNSVDLVFSRFGATFWFRTATLSNLTTFITLVVTSINYSVFESPALEIQWTVEEVFSGLNRMVCCMDDMLLHSEDESKHEQLKAKVLQRLQEMGPKLNSSKC